MPNIQQFSPHYIAKTNIPCNKSLKQARDTITLSFKGKIDSSYDEVIEIPFSDFLAKMKTKLEAKQIIKTSKDIKKTSVLEYRRAKSIIDGEEKLLTSNRVPEKDITETGSERYLYKSYSQGKLRKVTHFNKLGRNVLIDQIDVYNPNGTKDIIITNGANDVRLIRKGVKQIGPKSYLEDKIYDFTNGGILKLYYDNSSRVNDGIAKSKSETKHNVHCFKNGQLSYFVPTATYVGNELHYDKKYIFEDGEIKTYMIDVDVLRGEDEPRKRYDF